MERKQENKNTIHGHTAGGAKSKVYAAWTTMKASCYDRYSCSYHLYGAKGVEVCDAWRYNFIQFLNDMGEPTQPNMCLVLKKGAKFYSLENCYWGYRSNRLTYKGQTKTIAQWSEEYGLSKNTFQARLYKFGWPIEKALSTPVDKKRGRKISR